MEISEVPPYAVFTADNGQTGIMTLLQETNGTWKVVLPGKGIIEADLLTSTGIPLGQAEDLLSMCPPILRRSTAARIRAIYATPRHYYFRISGNRSVRSLVRSVRIPAQIVRVRNNVTHASHTETVPSTTAIECLL